MGKNSEPPYHAYLLRLWLADGVWRASLLDVKSGKRYGFANLNALCTYLHQLGRTAGGSAATITPNPECG